MANIWFSSRKTTRLNPFCTVGSHKRESCEPGTIALRLTWQLDWGKYGILPGRDALEGDTIEMIHNDGSRETAKVAAGRSYLLAGKSRMVFNNFAASQTERAREKKLFGNG